jgi:hypothetical protein
MMVQAVTVEVGCQTLLLTCDGCGQTEEVVITATRPDDALLPTVEQVSRAHGGMRRPSVGMGRWTANGRVQ